MLAAGPTVVNLRDRRDRIHTRLVNNCVVRMEQMRSYRLTWWSHWAALAEMFLPRRYKFFVTPNNYSRGAMINQSIVDETGMLAARVLATGLLSGLTSPTKPWASYGIMGLNDVPQGPAQQWLATVSRIVLLVLGESNFYQSWAQALHDEVVFGSSALIQYEDFDNVVNFFNPCLGEFFNGLNKNNEVETLGREYTYTLRQAADEFGLENLSPSSQNMAKQPASQDIEIVIGHMIMPNLMVYESGEALGYAVPKKFAYMEVFYERVSGQGVQQAQSPLRIRGFNEKPFIAPRWDVTSNDPYGRSPGMDALPATRQLQVEQRRKAEAIDKMVRPPMVGSVSMKNEPTSILPGGLTYVPDPAAAGFKPAFLVEPRVAEMMEDLKEVQARVQRIFFNDVIAPISGLITVRTATEIENRVQEALVQIGPVIERIMGDLGDLLRRTYAICLRRGLIPPAPPEIQGRELTIKFVSMFAETQRAAATTAIERLMAFVGNLVAVQPEIMDNINTDRVVEEYAAALNVSPDLIQDLKIIAAIRQKREQIQGQQMAMAQGQQLAEGAQTLSQTDVGGGQNALQLMLGNGGQAA